jgi:hypothetical protein
MVMDPRSESTTRAAGRTGTDRRVTSDTGADPEPVWYEVQEKSEKRSGRKLRYRKDMALTLSVSPVPLKEPS